MSDLAQRLARLSPAQLALLNQSRQPRPGIQEPVAIVGAGCRYPGAENAEAFWRLLRDGADAVSEVPADRWDLNAFYDADPAAPGKIGTRWGGFLDRVDLFDARFFGFSPREAEQMDPQQRLALEVAWEALEDAGLAPERLAGTRTGVFLGVFMDDYRRLQLGSPRRIDAGVATGTVFSIVANRLSYCLDLRGPSLALDTACSSSLVAIHLACRSLLAGESALALAGGVNLMLTPEPSIEVTKMGVMAPDGRCKAFDARADGYVRGEGAGIVVLKLLSRALADGDSIYALIRGSAVNHDGRSNGLMAPSRQSQEAVIREACERAGVSPGDVQYVETHGSGTQVGDSIEARALGAALAAGRAPGEVCAIGSVKTNIGHTETAAGVAGLLKVALALRHGEIPPSLHFETPNPLIPFGELPLRVQTALEPWPRAGRPALAGVSAFGFGGANAHVVLQEAPAPEPASPAGEWQLLVLSARTPAALDAASRRLAEHLRRHPGHPGHPEQPGHPGQPETGLGDAAFTLQTGRNAFEHRRFLVCRGREEAAEALETLDPRRILTFARRSGERSLAFLFPGLGDHYEGMGRGLYESEPVFRRELDRCAEILEPRLGLDVRAALYPSAGERAPEGGGLDLRSMLRRPASGGTLGRTAVAHPALFAVEHALAQTLLGWGLRPQALLGYSLGEYVAATLAGVFSLEDGLALVAERARLVQELPAGAMLAVPLSEAEVRPFLAGVSGVAGELSLSIVNGPELCVVGGPPEAVDALERSLAGREIACSRVGTGHAFHSAMMAPAARELARLAGSFRLSPPRIPFLSNVTGTWAQAGEVTRPEYWSRHLCQTVRFGDCLRELLADPERVLLEVGPGASLASFARQYPGRYPGRYPGQYPGRDADHPVPAFSTLRAAYDRQPDPAVLLGAAGRLWAVGVPVSWEGFQAGRRRSKVSLPAYPFERQRYWIEPPQALESSAARERDLADWFYLPVWKQSLPPAPAAAMEAKADVDAPAAADTGWLLFLDGLGLGAALADRLTAAGGRVCTVRAGEGFAREGAGSFTLAPGSAEDYRRLLREIGWAPRGIVHLWSFGPSPAERWEDRFAQAQDLGLYSLLWLARALAAEGVTEPLEVWAVSSGLQRVTGSEDLRPEVATLLAACRCIPQEYLNVTCRGVDLEAALPEGERGRALLDRLAAELQGTPADLTLAYRGADRWVQAYEPVRIEGAEGNPRLRPRGVYLITGGLGAIGLELAGFLARAVRARLVLTARTPLPPREDWPRLLAADTGSNPVARKVRQVLALEELGAEVLVLAVDAADAEGMRGAVTEAEERFGALHGVVHAAGLIGRDALRGLREIERPDVEAHFRAKVHGARVLEEVLAGRRPDFVLLMSSISSILGGLGFAGYAAANLFLDALAHRRSQDLPGVWLSVNWDGWRFEDDAEGQVGRGATNAGMVMSPAEGVEAFRRLLAAGGVPQIVNSVGGLEERIDQWVRLSSSRTRPDEPAAPHHSRPDLGTPYAAPEGEVERALVELWQETLGIGRLGVHDNFFELGGHSLLATRMFARLRAAFGADLPLSSLLDAPTPAGLARLIELHGWAARDEPATLEPAGAALVEGEL